MKKVIFFISFLISSFSVLGINFSVAPTKFEVDLSKTTNHEAYLINNTSKPLRIKIYTETPKSYEKNNFEKNIMIFPKMVSIKPGAKQEVRFRIKPDENMESGEYRSFLVFKEVPSQVKTETKETEPNLVMITETAINILGETGEVKAKGSIKNFKTIVRNKKFYMSASVLSEGNTSLKINYEIKEKNKKIFYGKFGNSLRTGEKKIQKEIPFEISNLKTDELTIILSDQNKNILYESKLII